MKTTTILFAALLLAGAAPAQTVWRCGADGRSYADSPCPEGRAVDVAAEARPAADIAAARRVAQHDQALADRLAAERRLREQVAPGTGLMGIRHERPADKLKPAKTAKGSKAQPKGSKRRPADDGTWRAAAPASPRKTG